MNKTLLLVFIHGFKGDDQTFAKFPAHLRALLTHALPNLNIVTRVYPQFSTTGDLGACVTRFREWLTNQVIDLEVELGTKSPTVEPGVRVVLVGHSMGGIVAAEAVLGIVGEDKIDAVGSEAAPDASREETEEKEIFEAKDKSTLMFPFVQGLLAFDTPYLGISPGVVAHTAEENWSKGKGWYEGAAGLFALGAAGKVAEDSKAADPVKSPAPSTETTNAVAEASPSQDAAPKTTWQRWGRTALFASAGAAAAAAAGTTAYIKRNELSSLSSDSFSWVTSHLQFVGCLARGEELKRRIESVSKLTASHQVGFANMYTLLGRGAVARSEKQEVETNSPMRTFCNLPKEKSAVRTVFVEAKNDRATDEVTAHMYMFVPKDNPGFYDMGDKAKELIASWVSKEWHDPTSESMDTT